jgi:RNA polymerase sigma factor (sigma-70 family)
MQERAKRGRTGDTFETLQRDLVGYVINLYRKHDRVHLKGDIYETAQDVGSDSILAYLVAVEEGRFRSDLYPDGDSVKARRAYCFRTAFNRACSAAQDHGRQSKLYELSDHGIGKEGTPREGDEAGTVPVSTPEEEFLRKQTRQAVRGAVKALPEKYRLVVEMELDGWKPCEMAKKLGAPVSTVRMRIYRAHEKLRKRLARFRG